MAAKILVVDDDPNVQRLLQYTLKQEGYDVVVAGDGAEGFRLWGAEAPDLILLDVMLPKLDGYQVAAKIRERGGRLRARPDHHAHGRARGRAEGPRPARRRGRLPHQAVPPGRAAGAHQEPARPVRPASDALLARPPMGRVLAFYGAKGGVGTTTIAINAAIALHRELGRKVCLVDGNLQFGDHRVFLDLGLDRKSIVDIVTAPVDRRRARPPGHGQARLGRRPAARAAVAGDRRARPPGAPADDHRAAPDAVRLRPRRRRQAARRRQPRRLRGRRESSSW